VVGREAGGDDSRQRRKLGDRQAERFTTPQIPAFGKPWVGEHGVAAEFEQDTGVGDPGELRDLLAADNPMDHPQLLRRHVTTLEERIARATAAKELIEHALSCPLPFDECPHAREQIAARIPPR
jgi:hypothetical protein